MSGWITVDACGPMRCAPMQLPGVGVDDDLAEPGRVLQGPPVGHVAHLLLVREVPGARFA